MKKNLRKIVLIVCPLIIFLILLTVLSLLYMNYAHTGKPVSSSNDFAIRKHFEQFYEALEFSSLGIDSWFLNSKVDFSIQDGILPVETDKVEGHVNSPVCFNELFQLFSEYVGKMQKYSVVNIEYYIQPYDVPESYLYYVKVEVLYENYKTFESFFLKKVNEEWKIFRYWIEYR